MMNKEEIKVKLEKVNRCYAHVEATHDISSLDKDVLLGAIRELYEACILEFSTESHSVPQVEKKRDQPSAPQDSDITLQVDSTKDEELTSRSKPLMVFSNKKKSTSSKKNKKVDSSLASIDRQQHGEEVGDKRKKDAKNEKVEVKSDVDVVQTNVVDSDSKSVSESVSESVSKPLAETLPFNAQYDDFFSFKQATDISQKLSEKPIQDLTKCLSLNDRFLFKKELFNNEDGKLEDVLGELNTCSDFEQARHWIENQLIESYNWTKNKQRIQKAKEFIKLTRRRFL